MSRQLEEFDLLTTDGFEELYHLVKIRDIEFDDDTVVILCDRLFEQYPSRSDDRRNAVIKLVRLIRKRV